MAFFSATADVASAIMGGALTMAERLLGAGWDVGRIMQELRTRIVPIGGQPFANQVYAAIINRAESALISGQTLQRRRSNRPLDFTEYTGSPGLANNFQYGTVVRFRDAVTGREFTKPFWIASGDELGKFDVLALAHQQALAFINQSTDSAGRPLGNLSEIAGSGRITDALVRI